MNATEPTASAMGTHSTLNAPNTNNATWFDYNEETSGYWDSASDWYRTTKYHYWQHLAEINRGRKRGGSYWNDPYLTYQANRDLISVVGSQLSLLPHQREEAQAWFAHFDLEKWGMRVDLIACCLCARVVHEDDFDDRQTHPNVPDDHEDKPMEFVKMSERFNLPQKHVVSMYGKVDTYLRGNDQPKVRKFDQQRTDDLGPSCRVTPSGQV
jgi:hypothetical protein